MVGVTWDGPAIMVITLDRPERRNALDMASLAELQGALAEATNPARPARVVVLTGAPPAFCAGADLDAVSDIEFATTLLDVLKAFTALPVPVIGAIDGAALGAGTRFGIPAARLGLAVDQWTADRVTEEFTPSIARAMLLAAETYDGERLHRAGVVHCLGGLVEAMTWAHEIAGLAPLTITAHKLALERSALELSPDVAVEHARQAAWASADAVEGRAAFVDRRPARFTGS